MSLAGARQAFMIGFTSRTTGEDVTEAQAKSRIQEHDRRRNLKPEDATPRTQRPNGTDATEPKKLQWSHPDKGGKKRAAAASSEQIFMDAECAAACGGRAVAVWERASVPHAILYPAIIHFRT
jgi:hypothetical protein